MTGWFDLPDWDRWFDWPEAPEHHIRVEEELKDGELVVRAEMPGIDPDKDVHIEVADGVLTIKAERKMESKEEKPGHFRSEFRYGSFVRRLVLPDSVALDDIKAAYTDGILEVRLPMPPAPATPEVRKIAVTKT
ncbi:MAG TPA: Hsp20/alpha crystallin family protein [Acidimicrobiales bacterium]